MVRTTTQALPDLNGMGNASQLRHPLHPTLTGVTGAWLGLIGRRGPPRGGGRGARRQWELGPEEDPLANVEACLGHILAFVTAGGHPGAKGAAAAAAPPPPSVMDVYHLLEWRRYCAPGVRAPDPPIRENPLPIPFAAL